MISIIFINGKILCYTFGVCCLIHFIRALHHNVCPLNQFPQIDGGSCTINSIKFQNPIHFVSTTMWSFKSITSIDALFIRLISNLFPLYTLPVEEMFDVRSIDELPEVLNSWILFS